MTEGPTESAHDRPLLFGRFSMPSRETWPAMGISLAMHGCLLIILGLWMLPTLLNRQPLNTVVTEWTDRAVSTEIVPTDQTMANPGRPAMSVVGGSVLPFEAASSPVVSLLEMAAVGPMRRSDTWSQAAADLTRHVSPEGTRQGQGQERAEREPREARISQAETIDDAAMGVLDEIGRQLAGGPTLTIWLLDQSLSMQRELDVMADRLESELTAHADRFQEGGPLLMHAAVAFGRGATEMVKPTPKPLKVLNAMREVPVDPTGAENVCTAIHECVQWYLERIHFHRDKNVMIVVLTDESSDDVRLLEATIAKCTERNVTVCVIGPSAVLGNTKGYHKFDHPANGVTYYLPVTRGADCGFPQRVGLPYWFRNVPSTWDENVRGPWQGGRPAWYGGSNLESILSGLPPYALTRLTRETGGTYTIFDRPGDGSPFELGRLRPYLPDYRSLREIGLELREPERRLRRAVLTAVRLTHGPVRVTVPRTEFGDRLKSPTEVQSTLGGEFENELQQVRPSRLLIEQALGSFGDWSEDEYDTEESQRWQAWYDLTCGRLLAASVRLSEYEAAISRAGRPGAIKPESNRLSFRAVPRLHTGRVGEMRARQARELLKRCVADNPDTPWQHLAERELVHPLGIVVDQRYEPAPPPSPLVPRPARRKVTLPNL